MNVWVVSAQTNADTTQRPLAKHGITVSIGVWNKVRINYEKVFYRQQKAFPISFTTTISQHYAIFRGTTFSAGCRFYGGKDVPDGFYFHPRFHIGYFYPNVITFESEQIGTPFWTFGFGGQLGYQYVSEGYPRFVFDTALGLKYLPLPTHAVKPYSSIRNDEGCDTPGICSLNNPSFYWYALGAGSIWEGRIAIGLMF